MHACVTSSGRYNLVFRVYQAQDLRVMDALWGADPFVRISSAFGEMRTDTRNGTVNPVWNQQLQLPLYEPLFRETLLLEVCHDAALSGPVVMSSLLLTWKDIISNQDRFRQARAPPSRPNPTQPMSENRVRSLSHQT
jgi:Ca2+-dependent lipid-binding protein